MRGNQQEHEPIPDPRVEELADDLLKLVKGDPRDTKRSITEIIHGGPRVNAVKMMLTWANAYSEAQRQRPSLGFDAAQHANDANTPRSGLSQTVLNANRASAGRVAEETLHTFFELAGSFGETYLQAGLRAQEQLVSALSEGISVSRATEIFHTKLDERNRGQQAI